MNGPVDSGWAPYQRILVVGPPRSGTTWIAEALRHGAGCRYVHEPDNERYSPLALKLKDGLGRFPVLEPGDYAPEYELLWRNALRAGEPRPWLADKVARGLLKATPVRTRERALRPDGGIALHLRAARRLASSDARLVSGPVVIKSVHCLLALDWLADRLRPSILIVMRNPLNVLASLRDLDMRDQDRDLSSDPRVRERVLERRGIAPPPPTADALERAAWQLGLFMTILTDAAERHAWPVVWHEDVCVDPRVSFERLGKEMGIGWSQAGDEFVRSSDRPGRGFSLRREASQQPDRWRRSLSQQDADSIRAVFGLFPATGSFFGPRPGVDGVA
jgi:hypothetical protein